MWSPGASPNEPGPAPRKPNCIWRRWRWRWRRRRRRRKQHAPAAGSTPRVHLFSTVPAWGVCPVHDICIAPGTSPWASLPPPRKSNSLPARLHGTRCRSYQNGGWRPPTSLHSGIKALREARVPGTRLTAYHGRTCSRMWIRKPFSPSFRRCTRAVFFYAGMDHEKEGVPQVCLAPSP
eukprot:gene9148-biopygen9234